MLTPTVDRHRGFRLVLAHLDYDDFSATPMFDLTEGGEPLAGYRVPAPPTTTESHNVPRSADGP